MSAGSARAWKITSAVAAALLVALVLYQRTRSGETPPAGSPPLVASSPSDTPASASTPRPLRPSPAVSNPPAGPPATAVPEADAAPSARPTPAVFDLAALARSRNSEQHAADPEPVRTTEWFTPEDLRHPERYFELAERLPELKRPEERRDTLAFFLRRERLQRDLEGAGDATAERQALQGTIARYDAAIARLRALIDAEHPR